VSQIIFDYMHICEKRGEILDPEAFVDLWTVANAIAEHAFRDGEPPSDLIDRILGKA
jgi:hypothetical protein